MKMLSVILILLVLILIPVTAFLGFRHFENKFHADVRENLERISSVTPGNLTEQDILHLPAPVKKYLHYTGVVNRARLNSVRIVFVGQMRQKGKEWFNFRSEQFNFFDDLARLFFMKAKMSGITVPGYHKYQDTKASMDIRLFGLFSVVFEEGEIMDKAETVTLFNDMCLLAPATLIDKRIKWEGIDNHHVKAAFTNGGNSITATLHFNGEGQLINFVSDDRYAMPDMKNYRFSTPVQEYKNINGINIVSKGEAVWHYPDGEFTYGVFNLSEVEFNPVLK
ncbi:MAG: hypothetical protein EDM75_10870 [Chlorobiota bacterium]|nr:MAG: hypothetical protein EDM75_10870 [Chlorobiota bacterium]